MIDQIPTIVVCLRSGGDYRPQHVIALAKQIEKNCSIPYRFVCYTDVTESGSVIPLEKNYPGWWSCVELWRHQGPTIAMGLDTMVLKNIDQLLNACLQVKEDEFYLLDSPFHAGEWINGIQMWNGDWSWLYEGFDYERISKTHRGEENYQIETLIETESKIKSIQSVFPSICNYKLGYKRRIGMKSAIIYFHGRPRPWQSPLWRLVK